MLAAAPGLFDNKGIAGFFADRRRMQGKRCRHSFGFPGFLRQHSPLFVEKGGDFDFSSSPNALKGRIA
jgi:hypothetical protein